VDFAIRRDSGGSDKRGGVAAHKCPQCREQTLVLQRRHVSPPQFGTPLVTEYYDCECCDAHYQYSPAEDRWKPIYR
jgi:hypothetical protein